MTRRIGGGEPSRDKEGPLLFERVRSTVQEHRGSNVKSLLTVIFLYVLRSKLVKSVVYTNGVSFSADREAKVLSE